LYHNLRKLDLFLFKGLIPERFSHNFSKELRPFLSQLCIIIDYISFYKYQ